jgi:transcriptional regulator with XRE-family HTH domain
MTTKDRTLRFIAYKGLSVKKFEEMCGLSNGYINSMKSGFGSNKLSQVLSVFSDLNRDWLVYGEGEMIKNHRAEESLPHEEEQGTFQDQDKVLIAELRSQIEKLEGKIDNLNQELGEKNALIKLLRNGEVESI